jgi:CubicO group peptidase (beta-lactamase class C family)
MRRLDRRAVLALATGAISQSLWERPAASAVQSAPPTTGPFSIESVVSLLKQNKVAGVSLAIFENGQLAATYCYGDAQEQHLVTPQTRFQAASISKTVNALGVLKLVQAGRVALDDPVNNHLKSWKLPDNALTAKTPVTVRMLLNHTGGTSVQGFGGYARGSVLPSLQQILDGQKPANSAAVRVVSPPGQAFNYSGGGTTILQQMVIDITGDPYDVAMEKLVLGPLGMSESSFRQPPDLEIVNQAAFAHLADGSPAVGDFHIYPEMAAAGLWTTGSDLCKPALAIMQSNAGRAGSFLSQNLARTMLTRGLGNYGLGVMFNNRGWFYHDGSNWGYRALFAADPKRISATTAMTNSESGLPVCDDLIQRVGKAYRWT